MRALGRSGRAPQLGSPPAFLADNLAVARTINLYAQNSILSRFVLSLLIVSRYEALPNWFSRPRNNANSICIFRGCNLYGVPGSHPDSSAHTRARTIVLDYIVLSRDDNPSRFWGRSVPRMAVPERSEELGSGTMASPGAKTLVGFAPGACRKEKKLLYFAGHSRRPLLGII